jgi:hypothetical protein
VKKLISVLAILPALMMPAIDWSGATGLKELAHTWLAVFRETHKNN